jgi:hypothetical protein
MNRGKTLFSSLRPLVIAGCAVVILAVGCAMPRVYRLTDQKRASLPAGASVDLYIGKLKAPNERIAIVDSERYATKDDAAKERMLEELKRRARKVGAEAVQDIRLLAVRKRGMIADDRAPIAGPMRQGYYHLYFLRGQAIHYLEPVPGEEAIPTERRMPEISKDEANAPATPDTLHNPAVVMDE